METTPRVDLIVNEKIIKSPLMSSEIARIKRSSGGLSLLACDVMLATPEADSTNIEQEYSRAS